MNILKKFYPFEQKPIIRQLVCGDRTLDVFDVNLTVKEYIVCETRAQNMWANSKKGQFGIGLINNENDKHKVERIGSVGEMAFAKVFGLCVDFTYLHRGDSYDFLLFGNKVNIKTSAHNYGKGLIRAITDQNKALPLTQDIYVFSFVKHDNCNTKECTVTIVGWETRENIKKLPYTPAIRGSHQNYQINYNNLQSISKLYNKKAPPP